MKLLKCCCLIALYFVICLIPAQAESDSRIVINIPSRTLELYKEDILIKTYPVGVGRKLYPTPTGNFEIINMEKNPAWENPYKPLGYLRIKDGKNSPLGTRWMGFKSNPKGEFGIHGTYNTPSVGKFCSHGCVRMHIKDSEELYSYITIGTPVIITYNTSKTFYTGQTKFIKYSPDTYNKGKNNINIILEDKENLTLHKKFY